MNLDEQHDAWEKLVNNWPAAPKYKGVTCQQHQSDLDRYAEVIRELKPAWLLQTGVYWGGTAAFLADVMAEHGGKCMFVDINLDTMQFPDNTVPNAAFVQADATSPSFYAEFCNWIDRSRGWAHAEQGLVSLDDDHTRQQVAQELGMYARHASYLVVEDTILDTAYGTHYQSSNPKQALDEWLPRHPEFSVDPDPEPTQHVGGWLRRIG